MTLTATSWSGKTRMWLLICLVAIATSDDFWSIAMANPSSELLVIADDDETDRSAERMPACASGGADYTDLHWFVRSATEIRCPAQPKNASPYDTVPAAPLPTDRISAFVSFVSNHPSASITYRATIALRAREGSPPPSSETRTASRGLRIVSD
jgi:hypothetical protein